MTAIILDIDNCIADDSWRIPIINWEQENPLWRYHDYHSLSGFDSAHNHDLYLNHRHDIIIFTARPIMYRAITQEWLKRHGVRHEVLMMRDMEDHRHSVELKKAQLQALLDNSDLELNDIVGAFDDRPDVVEMYKQHGINAHIRFVHDVCAYTNPQEKQNADRRQSHGTDAGNLQGARQDLQSQLSDDWRGAGSDVPRRDHAQDRRGPQQVASFSDDDDQSYPTR